MPPAAAVIGSVAASGSSSSATCSSSRQTTAYSTLASVITLSSFDGCSDDSGFNLMYSSSMPTDAVYVKMCASSNCQSLISSIIELDPPDCALTVPTSGLVINVDEMVTGFSAKCAALSSDSSASG
ncbi:Beta-elicitin DRE-beta [Phytophthora cinnamomi]|uniref:Beta-elicitin DRE-beta n=1 Tax=Phytophthora cinnamomi TaxID=4785 RepID=UPI00355A7BB0|nr:Beta-elicitin DRE-beta [Phytophthora cinnamomi]